MMEVYRGRARALYGQIELFDAEDTTSSVQWSSGRESLVFGPKGVAVAAAIDQLIDILVVQDATSPKGVFYGSGEISIGNQGLLIGNFVASTIEKVAWPPGKTKVDIYGDGPVDSARQIIFVLSRLTE